MATQVVVGDYIYNLKDDYTAKIYVADTSKSSYGDIITPYTYQGNDYVVTDMTSCFANCGLLAQSVVIPNSVTNMSFCFHNCTSFNQPITIPNSVIDMRGCFANCTSFNQPITIPNYVIYMDGCFESCTSFNQPIVIPTSVQSTQYCFRSCSALNNDIYLLHPSQCDINQVANTFSDTQRQIVLHGRDINILEAMCRFDDDIDVYISITPSSLPTTNNLELTELNYKEDDGFKMLSSQTNADVVSVQVPHRNQTITTTLNDALIDLYYRAGGGA